MPNLISDRIAIAKQFKSLHEWQDATHKAKHLKRGRNIEGVLVPFLLLLAAIISVDKLFHFYEVTTYWPKAGLLVGLAMGLSFRAPFTYIEALLTNHIERLTKAKVHYDKELDHELDRIITLFNKRNSHNYLKRSPIIILTLSASLQVLEANPYWAYFSLPVLFVSLYSLAQICYDIYLLKNHLKKAEPLFR